MKKGKLIILGIIALVLAGGLVLSCSLFTENCDGHCGKSDRNNCVSNCAWGPQGCYCP